MRINSGKLRQLVLAVAAQRFGRATFRRRQLMRAVEERVRQVGAWTPSDDRPSRSKGAKSAGMATIDWALSNLKGGGLDKLGHNLWKLH